MLPPWRTSLSRCAASGLLQTPNAQCSSSSESSLGATECPHTEDDPPYKMKERVHDDEYEVPDHDGAVFHPALVVGLYYGRWATKDAGAPETITTTPSISAARTTRWLQAGLPKEVV
jgi:hypothetical protein